MCIISSIQVVNRMSNVETEHIEQRWKSVVPVAIRCKTK